MEGVEEKELVSTLQLEGNEAALILSPDGSIQVMLPDDNQGGNHMMVIWMLARLLDEDDEFPNYVVDRLGQIMSEEEEE